MSGTPFTPSKSGFKQSKTPKRPQTGYRPRSGYQYDGPTLTFAEIKQVLAQLNYKVLNEVTLETLTKEQLLEIFSCLLTRIDDKYLFDIDNQDFNRSFLKMKAILRELGLSTSMSKQSFAGTFKKPLLFYLSEIIHKLYQTHGGQQNLSNKNFIPFKQQLKQFQVCIILYICLRCICILFDWLLFQLVL